MSRPRRWWIIGPRLWFLPIVLVALLALPTVATATFPGRNGQIAFEARNRQGGAVIYTIRPSGAGGRKVAVDGAAPAFSASGRSLLHYYVSDQAAGIAAWPFGTSASSTYFLTDPSKARTDLNPAPAPSGKKFAFVTRHANLFVAAVPTGAEYPAPRPLRKSVRCADWSPNGKSIAYLQVGRTRDTIRRVSPAGRTLSSIYRSGEDDPFGCPSWSPDGRLVAFSAEARGTRYLEGAILVFTRAGRLKRQLRYPVEGPGETASVAFSPDGKYIAYGSPGQGLNVIRLSDNKRRRLCNCAVSGVSWRPIPRT